MPKYPANSMPNRFAAMADVVRDDFAALNDLIPRLLTSDVDLVEEIGRYVVESGGKRLRPLIVLLGSRCCGYAGERNVEPMVPSLPLKSLRMAQAPYRTLMSRRNYSAACAWSSWGRRIQRRACCPRRPLTLEFGGIGAFAV